MNPNENRKKYIYNVNFANSIIESGVKCLGTGFNARFQAFYWVFDYDEIQTFYLTLNAEINRGVIRDGEKRDNNVSKSKDRYNS